MAIESHFFEMVSLAREYCQLINEIDNADCAPWLIQMSALLPRLHATVAAMGNPPESKTSCIDPDLEKRFELYSKIKILLGEHDNYWMEYDVAHDGQNMSGSLADDFTDIYFELKCGLELLEEFPELIYKAVNTWLSSYYIHWGQHLVDAERQLYQIRMHSC